MTAHGAFPGTGALLFGALLWGCAKGRQGIAPAESESATGQAAQNAAEDAASRQPAFEERRPERRAFVEMLAEDGIADRTVLRAMRKVPRHAFVLPMLESLAYADRPLPIVGGQTISQPYIVAFMTEAATPTENARCLEIGTGSGYQAAVLAEICKHTYSIEYLPEVARFGEKNLRQLGYGPDRVSLRVGDGYAGWPEAAPFDIILVTAAPENVPRPLLRQLAIGGRLVVPVGPSGHAQELERWTRLRAGDDAEAFHVEMLLPVRFVPFAGEHPDF